HTQGQLAWYRAMEERGELVQIRDRDGLDRHLTLCQMTGHLRVTSDREPRLGAQGTAVAPIGDGLSLEGADSIVTLRHLERAYEYGLRAIGPAHYGPGVYAQGTNATGGIGRKGRELLGEMERLGIILDATHLCDD